MKNLIFALFFLGLFSCEEMPDKEIAINETRTQVEVNIPKEDKEPEVVIQKIIPEKKSFQCKFGDIELTVKQEANQLLVNSNLENIEKFNHSITGDIISFIETDVNADGFNEFYCVMSDGSLIAYTSYRNKSFGEIYAPQMPKEFYDNIKKLESWEVKSNKLHLTFSNTADEVLNTVRYELIKGETNYQLKAN